MISYGGLPLEPTTAATAAAGTWWHGHVLPGWDSQGFLVPKIQHLPTSYFPKREEPRIGVLNWPTGADRFATCFLTATLPELTAIRNLLGIAPTEQPLVFDDGAGGVVTAPMYLIGTHPISQRGDGAEFYLLVFVDERYFWWQSGGAATPTTATSWTDLFTQLFASLGVDAAIGTIPAAYLTPNMNRWDIGVQPLPMVIQAAAVTVGMRVVRTLDGQVFVDDYATASGEDASRWSLVKFECLAGGQISGTDIARGLPAQVDTVFFNGPVVPTTLVSLALDQTAGVEGVDSRMGRVTADPADPTAGEQTAYAAQAALDYYNWAFSVTDATLRAFVAIQPCGLDEAVEWVHTADTMLTRVLRPPWADRNIYGEAFPDEVNIGSGSGSGSGCVTPVEFECSNGVRTATVTSTRLTLEAGVLGIGECATTTTDLGPCSPKAPGGSTLPVATRACFVPAGATLLITSDYTALDTDLKIAIDASGGSVTLTLPPWTATSLYLIIVRVDSGGGTVTILPGDVGGLINGAASATLATQWDSVTVDTLGYDSPKWFVSSRT